jgi:hypothetical protein
MNCNPNCNPNRVPGRFPVPSGLRGRCGSCLRLSFCEVIDALDQQVLRLLQATRHDPPGLASADAARRRRYGSALQQFEELMAAARTCGPASRPLPLFYALRQAGQAITAAYQQAQGGQLQGGHGLTVPARSQTLDSIEVAPNGQGSFQAVADATGSPRITAAVSAAALWASLPEGAGELPPGSAHLAALVLFPEDRTGPSAFLMLTDRAVAWVFGFPETLGITANRIEFLRTHLGQYPTANGWESLNPANPPVSRDPVAGWGARLQWRLPQASGSAAERVEHLLAVVAPRYDRFSTGWIRPVVGSNHDNPSPLMTWWALLYALSMLARYYPDQWVKMLDLDHSPDAAPLMTILDDALVSGPRLVLGALRRSPYLTA